MQNTFPGTIALKIPGLSRDPDFGARMPKHAMDQVRPAQLARFKDDFDHLVGSDEALVV